MTPREFHLISEAEQERRYDDMEDKATSALMQRTASNKEKIKFTDLYDRPEHSIVSQYRGERFKEEVEGHKEIQDFLSTVKFD